MSRRTENSKLPEPFTTERLCNIWEKICSESRARQALKRLDDAGFPISHSKPMDATFKQPSWADYIAAIPLVANKPSTRRIYQKAARRKYWPLVRELRKLAAVMNLPFVGNEISSSKDYPIRTTHTLREDLLKAAWVLEQFLSWNYYVRQVNPRNALIAELRWAIRYKTGAPHDRELNILFDAAYRAAGRNEGCYIDSSALDRIEKRQKESRMKASRRIRGIK